MVCAHAAGRRIDNAQPAALRHLKAQASPLTRLYADEAHLVKALIPDEASGEERPAGDCGEESRWPRPAHSLSAILAHIRCPKEIADAS